MITLHCDDCRVILQKMADNSIDAVVTDPPYELGLLGKDWDKSGVAFDVSFWREIMRVLKPGGHVLAFAYPRLYHRLACSIEDAGFEIRDMISWIYGTGYPKSYNIAKAIESTLLHGNGHNTNWKKLNNNNAGNYRYPWNERNLEYGNRPENYDGSEHSGGYFELNAETPEGIKWDGWGTNLKPACEPIALARKPISESSVALNVIKWGTGAINIDDTRIELNGEIIPINVLEKWSGFGEIDNPEYNREVNTKGRFPANVIFDDVAAITLDIKTNGAARYFYVAKPTPDERSFHDGTPIKHPTMKPILLMRYLIRMITPDDGIVLDPFGGSGTTMVACHYENKSGISIEMDAESFIEMERRVNETTMQPLLPGGDYAGN